MSIECELCSKIYGSKNSLNNHYNTNLHKNNLAKIKPIDKSFIVLKRKNIPDTKVLVDEKVFDHVKNIKGTVCYSKGSSYILINNIKLSFSRYIYYDIYENSKNENMYIIHINNDSLDNRIENLREVSAGYRNLVDKNQKSTSKYYGVSIATSRSAGGKPLWQCQLRSKTFRYNFAYESEEHAAYHYDLLVKKHNLEEYSKMNNIIEPVDFIMKTTYKSEKILPKYIYEYKEKYYYKYRNISGEKYNTIEEAQKSLDIFKIQYANDKIQERINKPINRNIEDIAILELFNKKGEKIAETMIDDDDYYELIKYKWYINSNNRVSGTVNNKTVILSRFVINYDGKKMVDHINSNPLDNRKCNLRIIDVIGNNQNRTKSNSGNLSSIYIGVYKKKNKWVASITYNGKKEFLGRYITEKEAAIARDTRVNILNTNHNCYYKLNFPVV